MFKVGDKVVIVFDLVKGMDSEEIGKICTVEAVEESSGRHFLVGSNVSWFDEELCLYEENKICFRVVGRDTYVFFNGKVGKARCHPDDKFNILTGVMIGLDRIKNNGLLVGDKFFYINAKCGIEETVLFDKDSLEIVNSGNAFRTKDEALKAAEKIKEVLNNGKHCN